MSRPTRASIDSHVNIGGKRISISVIALEDAKQPRLRFDRVAVGLVRKLQDALAESVPRGKTVVVTITAPIWQDSKTRAALEIKIRDLLVSKRTRLEATINGNTIQVRVLHGGADRTAKLIGFVHNPKPDPEPLFDAASSLLECIGSGKSGGERWLVVAAEKACAQTIQDVYIALDAKTVFERVVLAATWRAQCGETRASF
jgi:hypothetical protein